MNKKADLLWGKYRPGWPWWKYDHVIVNVLDVENYLLGRDGISSQLARMKTHPGMKFYI